MLAIGRALMSRPRLLLLDEPSLGLAPLMVERIFETIAELKRQGRTILLVEQNVHQALDVADRAYVLETGRITLDGRGRRPPPRPEGRAVVPRRRRGRAVIDYAIQQVVNALSAGSLYALMAVGLAMVFGILRLINFAHGDLMMIAAYIAVFCLGAGLSLLVALPIIIVGDRRRRPADGAGRLPAAPRRARRRAAAHLVRGRPDPPERRRCSTTRLAGQADADRLPEPGAAQRRRHDRRDHDPEGQRRQLRRRDRPARAADRVRDPDDARACRCGPPPRTCRRRG